PYSLPHPGGEDRVRGLSASDLIMKPALADMNHRLALVQDAAGSDFRKKQLVIAHRATASDPALQVRQRLPEHGAAAGRSLHLQARKSRLIQREAPAEMGNHIRLALIQNIEREGGALSQPGED